MFPILRKQKLAEDTYLIEVEAGEIAKKAKPGQFIVLRANERAERIPITIADIEKKSLVLIVLVAGKTTELLSTLRKGDSILDVAGPLGNAAEVKEFGNVILVGGGIGIAAIYPIAKALKRYKMNKIGIIIGAKNRKFLFWEDKLKAVCHEFIVCTDDGSKGGRGFVTKALKEMIEFNEIHKVIAVGPAAMMKNVADITKDRVRTNVSLNPIMIDGMGMCGCCRVIVEGKIKFSCIDGPEFNAHLVDWEDLSNRNETYKEEECKAKISLKKWLKDEKENSNA